MSDYVKGRNELIDLLCNTCKIRSDSFHVSCFQHLLCVVKIFVGLKFYKGYNCDFESGITIAVISMGSVIGWLDFPSLFKSLMF